MEEVAVQEEVIIKVVVQWVEVMTAEVVEEGKEVLKEVGLVLEEKRGAEEEKRKTEQEVVEEVVVQEEVIVLVVQ